MPYKMHRKDKFKIPTENTMYFDADQLG